jgi:hypothetical protein
MTRSVNSNFEFPVNSTNLDEPTTLSTEFKDIGKFQVTSVGLLKKSHRLRVEGEEKRSKS